MLKLKKIRTSQNLTMKEVCQIANVSVSYYSLIEGGFRTPPVKTAKRIAGALGFDWTRFYE